MLPSFLSLETSEGSERRTRAAGDLEGDHEERIRTHRTALLSGRKTSRKAEKDRKMTFKKIANQKATLPSRFIKKQTLNILLGVLTWRRWSPPAAPSSL